MKGQRVKVLVDSGASDIFVSEACAKRCKLTVRCGPAMRVTLADGSVKTTGSVAYSKFTAKTTTGTYSESSMAMRVLPLGIAVDMVLGGKWLRSLSPITLDYEGHGSVSFSGKISSWDWPARGRVTEPRAEGGPKEKLRTGRHIERKIDKFPKICRFLSNCHT